MYITGAIFDGCVKPRSCCGTLERYALTGTNSDHGNNNHREIITRVLADRQGSFGDRACLQTCMQDEEQGTVCESAVTHNSRYQSCMASRCGFRGVVVGEPQGHEARVELICISSS